LLESRKLIARAKSPLKNIQFASFSPILYVAKRGFNLPPFVKQLVNRGVFAHGDLLS
jgi:hypothetical protein